MTPATGPLEPDTTIDIAHESLIRQWDKLRDWMTEEFTSAALWRRLSSSAADWQSEKASAWVAHELETALAWRERERPNEAWVRRYGGNLPQAFSFLEASRRYGRRRLVGRIIAWVPVVAIVGVAVAGFVLLRTQRQHERDLFARSAQEWVRATVPEPQPEDLDLARQLALQALATVPDDTASPIRRP